MFVSLCEHDCAVPMILGNLTETLLMQAGSSVGKKRTHRVRGASLSPRGKSQDGTGAADEASEADTDAASSVKPGSEGGLAEVEAMEAPGTPDESVESAVLTPRSLSTGSTLPIPNSAILSIPHESGRWFSAQAQACVLAHAQFNLEQTNFKIARGRSHTDAIVEWHIWGW